MENHTHGCEITTWNKQKKIKGRMLCMPTPSSSRPGKDSKEGGV